MSNNGKKSFERKDYDALIRYFDSTDNSKLEYKDFVQILLPCTDDGLRETNNKEENYKKNFRSLNTETVEALYLLLEKELDYHCDVESIKCDLAKCKDFDVDNLFNKLDYLKQGFLDFCTIEKFLLDNGFKASESDVNSIIRRMDVTANAQISYNEFSEGIKYEEPRSYAKPIKAKPSTPKSYITSIRNKSLNLNKNLVNQNYTNQSYSRGYLYQYSSYTKQVNEDKREALYNRPLNSYNRSEFVHSNQIKYEGNNANSSPTNKQKDLGLYLNENMNHDCPTCKQFIKSSQSYPESIQDKNNALPTQESFGFNEENDRFNYGKSYDNSRSYTPYFQNYYNQNETSPSRFTFQQEENCDQRKPYKEIFRSYGLNDNFEKLNQLRSKPTSSNIDISTKSYYQNFRSNNTETDKLVTDQQTQNTSIANKNSNIRKYSFVNYRDNGSAEKERNYLSYANSNSPSHKIYQNENIKEARKEYPTYPGGYISNEQAEDLKDNTYSKFREDSCNRFKRELIQANCYSQSPESKCYNNNFINSNEMSDKTSKEQTRQSSRINSRNYEQNRSKSQLNYENSSEYNRDYSIPTYNKYSRENQYTSSSIYRQNMNSKDSWRDEYNNIGSNLNLREKYRNSSETQPQKYDQKNVDKMFKISVPMNSNPLGEELKSFQFSDHIESPSIKEKSTPKREETKSAQQKGAFNMVLNPDITTKTDGWSIVTSPDEKEKISKIDEAMKNNSLDGIQKIPLRI